MKRYLTIGRVFVVMAWLLCPRGVGAQVNISGKPGLMNIPTARVLSDGTFHIGYHYNPSNYDPRVNDPNAVVSTKVDPASSSIFYAHLAMLPRLEINLNIFRVNGYLPLKARGIGDRQFDIKYAVLTETERRPSVVVIASTPFGVDNSLVTYAVAATKNYALTEFVSAEVTAGFGSPFYFDRSDNGGNDFNLFSNYKLHNKNDRPNPYLSGPFGGVVFRYKQQLGGMIEWDSRHVNVGAYATLFKHWTIQAGVINFDQITFGSSYAVSLLELPKRLRRTRPGK